jgi:transposase
MRGTPDPQLSMLSSLSTEDLIPPDHPIRRIRVVVDTVLAGMDATFDAMYAAGGRRSVPPETLLKSSVLMALYSIRSERSVLRAAQLQPAVKWFLDMRIDQPAFDATTFTKNRRRLLDAEVADAFFAAVVDQAKLRRYVSSDHFSVISASSNTQIRRSRRRRSAVPPAQGCCRTRSECGFLGSKGRHHRLLFRPPARGIARAGTRATVATRVPESRIEGYALVVCLRSQVAPTGGTGQAYGGCT